ncbi:family 16 glycosylhydrolase [Kribbella sp. NPDC050470]|uniref:golvesin C-terminal-like domain-containing protein n=1 Tax=unclassified Kribbella TaxID=2644121 RepID=UPI0037958E13
MKVRKSVHAGIAGILLAAGLVTLPPASSVAGATPSLPVPGYQLAWSDEFDGTRLDTGSWFYREGEKAICSNNPGNVTVSDGSMRIALKREDRNGKPYTCGGVISRKTFGYGYYETRAKLWGYKGFHSALWTTGLSDYVPDTPLYKGPNNRVNEIDGFEVDSHAPDLYSQVSHWFVPQHIGNPGGLYKGPDSSDGYHVYGFEWTPTQVRYFIDGQLTRVLPKPGPHGLQNIWLTTLGFTAPVDESNLPGETAWDYFRYYAPVQPGADVTADTVVVDNGDPGYSETGTWSDDITDGHHQTFGFQGKDVRRTDDPAASATWRPQLPAKQSYEVFVWNPSYLRTGHKAARYTVSHDGGQTSAVVNQDSAGQQWVSLGAYQMTPGRGQGVRVTSDPAGSGTLRTDAVKFVPAVVVDNDQAGYSEQGTWQSSNTVTGWRGQDTRWSGDPAATARWAPTLPGSTTYDVYAWIPDGRQDTETRVGVTDPGYTESGAWAASSLTGWDGTATRTTNDTKATAAWRPDLPIAGQYEVSAWVPNDAISTTAARYTVEHPGGQASVDVDQTTGGKRWISLGTYEFTAGTAGRVTIANAAGRGYLRTNVVRFVRVGADQATPPTYTVTHAGGVSTVGADLSLGADRWVKLGNFAFDAGSNGSVELNRAAGGVARADAIKFLPAPASAPLPSAPSAVFAYVQPNLANGDQVLQVRWQPTAAVGYHVYLDGNRVTWQPVRDTSFRMYELLAGQTHRVTVTSVDRAGKESAPSTPFILHVPMDKVSPAPSTELSAEATNGGAVLYWPQSTEVDLHGYHVYADGRRITDVPTGNPADAQSRGLGFPVGDLTNNVAHTLAVTVVDQSGNESKPITVSVTPKPMAIVGINDAGYSETGAWTASSVPGWQGTPTRTSNSATASADWRPTLETSGEYDVYAWVPNHSNSTTAARYTVTHSGGSDATTIDQTTGGMRWILLGRYTFTAGTTAHVTLTNAAGTNWLRTSAVKFVPA